MEDAFVAKIDGYGALAWVTYLIGSSTDIARAITVDGDGSVLVAGSTASTDFQTTPGVFLPNPIAGLGQHAFVSKLSPTGGLVWSTYFARAYAGTATWNDWTINYQTTHFTGYGVDLNSAGSVYLTGGSAGPHSASGGTGPLPPADLRHVQDAFVGKLSTLDGKLQAVRWDLGGAQGADEARGLTVHSDGLVSVAGWTESSDFPVCGNYYVNYSGARDAFLTTLTASLGLLTFSTHLGGAAADQANAVAVDPTGNVYVTGKTASFNFPTRPTGVFSTLPDGADAFVTKFGTAGGPPLYSLYLGGSGVDAGYGVAADEAGQAYVVGETLSANFPAFNARQPMHGGLNDAFLTVLNADGTALVRSTFLGGMATDWGRAVALDDDANPAITGGTTSLNFPVINPLQGVNAGGLDAFAVKDVYNRVIIRAWRIDQDDPAIPPSAVMSPAGPIVYGGSIPSTADNLLLRVEGLEGTPAIASVTWTLTGRGSDQYPNPGNVVAWNVGDIKPIPAAYGDRLTFRATVNFVDGSHGVATRRFEVGIRTDDTLVVGFIKPDWVPLSSTGVRPRILAKFPLDGNVPPHIVPATVVFLLGLSWFQVDPDYPTPAEPPPPGDALTSIDRHYILNWVFKYAGNPIPPPDHFVTNGIVDYLKIGEYENMRTRYKLFNHFQVKHRVLPNNGAYDVFNGAPIVLERAPILSRETEVGITIDPVTQWKEFPGQYGPQDNVVHVQTGTSGHYFTISRINDGSPEAAGNNAHNELLGDTRHLGSTPPAFWENIGSRIQFTPSTTVGEVFRQAYPTYYVYRNGVLSNVFPQAAYPSLHFYPHAGSPLKGSYPVGTIPSFDPYVMGGRDGDYHSAVEATSRIPPTRVYFNPATGNYE